MTKEKIDIICSIAVTVFVGVGIFWAFRDFKRNQKRTDSENEALKKIMEENFLKMEQMAKRHYDDTPYYMLDRPKFRIEIERGIYLSPGKYANLYWIHMLDLHKAGFPRFYTDEENNLKQ